MFSFTKISDVGTSSPIVARISIGLSDIIDKTELRPEQKEDAKALCFELAKDLVFTYRYGQNVLDEIKGIEERLKEKYQNVEAPTTPTSFESLQSTEDVRNFFKYLKSSLRLTARIMSIVLDITSENNDKLWNYYQKGRFDEILKNLNINLLPEHPAAKIIEAYSKWLKFVSEVRDEDEHPKSDKDFIENYRIILNDNYNYLQRPRLYNDEDLEPVLEHSMKYLLPFCEDICIQLLVDKLSELFCLEEIQECNRDTSCPKRFKITLGSVEFLKM